jgi:hypothetical protein
MLNVALITRRSFLTAVVGLGLFATIATGFAYGYRRPLYRRYLQLKLDEFSDKGTLSPDEFQTIRAAFEVVSPKPPPPAEEFFEFVNWRTSTTNGYYREYQRAVKLLESKTRARFEGTFATLNAHSREEILREVMPRHTFLPLQEGLPNQEIEPSLVGKFRVIFELLFFNTGARFKYFIFWDLLRFYWLSSAGWAVVGYQSYPGVPDPHRTYTSAPRHAPTARP